MAGKTKSLKWYGKAVTEKMAKAQVEGVNQTMAECVKHAKNNHPWQNRSSILEGSIDVKFYARATDTGVKGVWGVWKAKQALILELGGTIVPRSGKYLSIPQSDGSRRLMTSVTIPPYPYLRPAADVEYPGLAERIRKAFEKPSAAS